MAKTYPIGVTLEELVHPKVSLRVRWIRNTYNHIAWRIDRVAVWDLPSVASQYPNKLFTIEGPLNLNEFLYMKDEQLFFCVFSSAEERQEFDEMNRDGLDIEQALVMLHL
jgi:hypothetical protein